MNPSKRMMPVCDKHKEQMILSFSDDTETCVNWYCRSCEDDVMIPDQTDIKDSGAREVFTTGAQRDRQHGKGKPSLVPGWVIWLVSRVYEDGALKYSARNWEKGMPLSNYIDSMERHLMKLKAGMRDEPHASMIVWNAIGYIFTAAMIKMGYRPAELNDMPDQLSANPLAIAEPLSPHEYKSLETFLGRKVNE